MTYTVNQPDDLTDIANRDYFGRIDGSSGLPGDVSYSNPQGTGFYGIQDADGANSGNIDTLQLDWAGVNISGFTGLQLPFYVAEDDSTDGFEDWDTTSSLRVSLQIDGGGFNNVFAIESELGIDGNETNEVPRVDTDSDGVGDGAEITDTFTQYVVAVPVGATLDVRIVMEFLDAGDEDIALDNVMLATFVPVELMTFEIQ